MFCKSSYVRLVSATHESLRRLVRQREFREGFMYQWNRNFSRHGCIQSKAMSEFEEHDAEIHNQALQAKKDLLDRIQSGTGSGWSARAGSAGTTHFSGIGRQ